MQAENTWKCRKLTDTIWTSETCQDLLHDIHTAYLEIKESLAMNLKRGAKGRTLS